MITGFPLAPKEKKNSRDSGKTQTTSACLFAKQTIHLCTLHPTAKTPGTRAAGHTTFAPLLSLQWQWWSGTWVLRPPGTRVCVPVFHVCCCGFGFS